MDNGDFEGYQSSDNQIKATYLHGIFDNPEYLTTILSWAGIANITSFDYEAEKDKQIETLASAVACALPIEKIKSLLSLPRDTAK